MTHWRVSVTNDRYPAKNRLRMVGNKVGIVTLFSVIRSGTNSNFDTHIKIGSSASDSFQLTYYAQCAIFMHIKYRRIGHENNP